MIAEEVEIHSIAAGFHRYSHKKLCRTAAELQYRLHHLWQDFHVLQREMEDARWEIMRLRDGNLPLEVDSDYESNALAKHIHNLAYVSVANGKIIGSKTQARKGGKTKHAKHTEPHKAEVRRWWTRWQRESNLYKNKAAFDAALADKTGKTVRTVTKWRIELQNEHKHSTGRLS